MTDAAIRAIQDADVPGAAAALVQVHATDGYPVEGVAQPTEWISASAVAQAWVAEAGGRIIGHVAVMRPQGENAVALWQALSRNDEAPIGVLARLYVVREARGHSVGERLVREAMAYAKGRGMRLVLDVMTKDRSAIRLYERMGWRTIGEATHGFGDGQQIGAVCYVAPAG